jgi:hypothetical protein
VASFLHKDPFIIVFAIHDELPNLRLLSGTSAGQLTDSIVIGDQLEDRQADLPGETFWRADKPDKVIK